MAEYRIYKPRKDKTTNKFDGSATKWESNVKERKTKDGKSYKEVEIWLTGTKQTGEVDGNATFDWNTPKNPNGKQIVMKLGDPDVGELLALFTGKKKKLGGPNANGLYHQNDKGSTALQVLYYEQQDKTKYEDRYQLRLSSKQGNELLTVEHAITLGEAEILRNLLEAAIRRKYAA